MLQDRIMKNQEYFKGIEMLSGYPILKVYYPSKWGVFNRQDEKVKVAKSDEVADEWFYYTTDTSVSLDDMFDLMEDTINVNQSAIAKIELLKSKVSELKELFGRETLENLQNLEFVINKPKVKPNGKKRGRKKTAKNEPIESVDVVETENKEEEVNSVVECVN